MLVQTTVREIVDAMGAGQEALLQILLAVQEASPDNYVSDEAINEIAAELGISHSRVYSTASFYSAISVKSRGRHVIRFCTVDACENVGRKEIIEAVEKELAIKMGETTADKHFSLEGADCLGACYMAPVMKIDRDLYGHLTPETAVAIIRRYRQELDCERLKSS